MDKELINEIRRLLNFMEEFDSLVAKAKKESDAECEEELYGHLSSATLISRTDKPPEV